MKKNLLLVLVVIMITLTFSNCMRDKVENEPIYALLNDSTLVLMYADNTKAGYELHVDTIEGTMKMKEEYQKSFLSDLKNHGSIISASITSDINDFCLGKTLDIIDTEDTIIRRIEFAIIEYNIDSSEISFPEAFEVIDLSLDDQEPSEIWLMPTGALFFPTSGPYLFWKEKDAFGASYDILGLKDPRYISFVDSLNKIELVN